MDNFGGLEGLCAALARQGRCRYGRRKYGYQDDPMLLPRTGGEKQPARVIVDSRLRTPLKSKIFSSADVSPVIIATTGSVSGRKAAAYVLKGATILFAKSKRGRIDLKDLLRKLGGMNLIDILVEGGGELIAGLIEERLADRFLFFIAPKIIGGESAVTSVEGSGISRVRDALNLGSLSVKRFSKDILIEARTN